MVSHNNMTGSSFDEKTGRWSHTFSQSFLGELQLCPESARSAYFREVKLIPTDAMVLGNGCHAGFEYGLTAKQAGDRVWIDDCIEVARMELDLYRPWRQNKLTEDRMQQLIPKMLLAWERDFLPYVDPLEGGLEAEFNLPFLRDDKRSINLSGTVDMIDTNYEVWDWKTASRAYEAWEKQRWNVQSTVYGWAIDQVVPIGTPAQFHLAIMLHDGTTQQIDVVRTQAHVDWLTMQCLQVATMIEAGIKPWPLNDGSWKCSPMWCAKFSDCKGSVGIDERWATVPEKEVANVSS